MDIFLNFRKKIKYFTTLCMALYLVTIAMPTNATAGTSAYLAMAVDVSSYSYTGTVITSDTSMFTYPEKKFLSNSDRPLSFPNNNEDLQRIDELGVEFSKNILVSSLNSAVYKINDGESITSANQLKDLTDTLLTGGTKNGYTVKVGQKTGKVYMDFNYDIDSDGTKESLDSSSYTTISKSGQKAISYVSTMPKYTSNSDDKTEITWELLSNDAWDYYNVDIDSSNITEKVDSPNILTASIAKLISAAVSGIQNILGLVPIQDLVFNDGLRDTSQYVYGIFSSSWQKPINIFFMIFQAIAWTTILLSIINLVFKKNLATMSSSMRVDVMISVQQLIFAGIALALMFPLLNVVMKLSYLLTDVFSNVMAPEAKADFFSAIPKYGNGIAAVLIFVAYFVASVLINVSYVIRAITVAVLISASPLFVVFITLGDKFKKISTFWMSILLSNIFMQPINALVLGFMMSVPYNSIRGIEALVFIYAMIPISELIRELLFGRHGSTGKIADRISNNASRDVSRVRRRFSPKAVNEFIDSPTQFVSAKFNSKDKEPNSNSSSSSGNTANTERNETLKQGGNESNHSHSTAKTTSKEKEKATNYNGYS